MEWLTIILSVGGLLIGSISVIKSLTKNIKEAVSKYKEITADGNISEKEKDEFIKEIFDILEDVGKITFKFFSWRKNKKK